MKFTCRTGATEILENGVQFIARGTNNTIYIDDVSLIEVNAEGNMHLSGSPITFTASALIGEADNLVYAQGDSQYSVVGNRLEEPLALKVTDKCGNIIVGHNVNFEVMQGGGFLDGSSTLKSVTKKTDSNGRVQTELTLGTTKGEYNNIVEARAARIAGTNLNNSPFRFYASARPSDADRLSKISGDNQTNKPVRQKLPEPFIVKVIDRQGNGVDSHPVQFSVKTGNGTFESLDGESVKTVNTDQNGQASVYYYPGPKSGELNIIETRSWNGAPELNGSPVSFIVTPVTGFVSPTISTIAATGPVLADAQSQSFITIVLTDAFANPISGKAVIINVSGSNNFITQPITLTDANGRTTGSLASTRAEMKTITAFDVTDGVQITSSASAQFVSLDASNISMVSGSNQQSNFNAILRDPVVSRITDRNGNPVFHHPVYFEAYQGGGSMFDLNKQRVNQGQAVFTDANGIASVYWALGPTEEVNRARATSSGLNGTAEFIATAHSGQASMFYRASGNNQSGISGYVLSEPLVCKVTDSNGDAIYNYPVKFKVTFGGGSFNNESQLTLSTNHFGEASVNLTLGRESGVNTVEVTANGLTGSPQYFTATGEAGDAAKMVKVSGDGFTGTVGSSLSGITVAVTDLYDNIYRNGYDILFSIVQGNASIVGSPTVTTGPNGQASVSINLGTIIGDVIVQAYAAALINNPLRFKVSAKAAAPVKMSIARGDDQQGTIGRELVHPFDVFVVDTYNNPVENVGISFVKTGGSGNLLTPQLIYSDVKGLSSARFQLGAQSGAYQVMAVKNGLTGSPLYFDATGVTNNFPLFQGLKAEIGSSENQNISFNVTATDDDSDPLSYEAKNLPQGATFDALNTRRFSWTPNFIQAGKYQVQFIVRDNRGGLDDEIVNIDVANFNRLPQIVSFQPTQEQLTGHKDVGQTFYFSVTVNDQDSDDIISYQWFYDDLLVSTSTNYSFYVNNDNVNIGDHRIVTKVTDGHDIVERSWEIIVKTPVELVSFSAASEPRQGVRLTWKTNHEAHNAGFYILRSQTQNGIFKPVNESMILSNDSGEYAYVDSEVKVGESYYYRLQDVSIHGKRTEHEIIKIQILRPERFELAQNYPNPFNPMTRIHFQMPEQSQVILKVYNLLGQEIVTLVNENKEAGYHTAIWDGLDQYGHSVSSGIYYYRLTAGSFVQSRKMVLIR